MLAIWTVMTLNVSHIEPTDRTLSGVALMLGFCITAPLLDVSAKLASYSISVGQITAARFVVQCVLMAPFLFVMKLSLKVDKSQWLALCFRAGLLLGSTFCFIAAISVMPLADALAIVFVAPFIVLFVGKFYLGENVGPRRIGAALVGFLGVLFVIQPSFAAFGAVALFPLGTALSFAFYILVTRGLSRRIHPVTLQFYTGSIASIMCVPVIIWSQGKGSELLGIVWPEGIFWLWLLGVGFFATVSHLMMTYALSLAASATLAPLQYFELPVAALLGLIVFGDFPNTLALIGVTIIIIAGLYMIYRERVSAREAIKARADAIAGSSCAVDK